MRREGIEKGRREVKEEKAKERKNDGGKKGSRKVGDLG